MFFNNSTKFGIKGIFPYWSIHHSCNLFMKQYESIGTLPIPCFFSHCLFDLKILVMILRKQTIAFLRPIAISPCPDCLAIYKFIIHPNTITHKLSHQHNEITGVIAPFQLCVHTNVSSPRLTKHMTVSLPPRPVMWVQYTLPQTTQTAPGRATSQHR